MRRPGIALAFILIVSAAHGDNSPNDYLLSITPGAQAKMLGSVVGVHCVGQTAFYMGIGETGISEDKAFWSVRCTDRREFNVQVNPDGTTSILESAVLKALNAGVCFKKLKGD